MSVSVFLGSRRGFGLGFGLDLDPSLRGGLGIGRSFGRGRVGPGLGSLSWRCIYRFALRSFTSLDFLSRRTASFLVPISDT